MLVYDASTIKKEKMDDDTLTVDSDGVVNGEIELLDFTCERCGFKYKKAKDFAPFLCYRCMRFIAKKVWTIVRTIQPATSRPVVQEV